MESHAGQVTQLLIAWHEGDASALDRLLPLLYDELHAIARRHLRDEHAAETLQATGLVHEAYIRLVGTDLAWEGRRHFLAISSNTMRRVLVDHARARARAKRGGGMVAVSLGDRPAEGSTDPLDVIAVDEAMDRLARADERKARAVELHYFGGLQQKEIAGILGVSLATVERDLRFALSWIYDQVQGD